MVTRRTDDGVSRMPLLFTTVGVLIVASVVSLVLVTTTDEDSGASGNAAAAPTTSAPVSVAPSATPAPSSSPVATPSTSPVARNTPAPSTSPVANETPAARKAITYTVKKGDNLTVIAAWFKLHGYGDLYQANRKVIGADPDLIRPGQRITVSSDGMTLSRR